MADDNKYRPTSTPTRDESLISSGTSSAKQWERVFGAPERPPVPQPQPRPSTPVPPPTQPVSPPQPSSYPSYATQPAVNNTPSTPPVSQSSSGIVPPRPSMPAAPTPSTPPRPQQPTQPSAYTPPSQYQQQPTNSFSPPGERPHQSTIPPITPSSLRPAQPNTSFERPPVSPPPTRPIQPSVPPIPPSSISRPPVPPPPIGGRPAVPPPPVGGATASQPSNRPTLTDMQFETFSKLIYELSGMRFTKSKSYFIATKVDVRCKALGINNFDDYYAYLNSMSGRAEYGHLIDEITINETFFYRHQPQLTAFVNEVFQPLLFARKQQHQPKIRIWSCAASTGDEAYTVALMIKDMNIGNDTIIEIVGTDICHDALQKARAGRYKKYAVRNIPQHQLERYFIYDEPTRDYILSDEIKKMVKFQESNLMDAQRIASLGKFDIAFCRNVLIYFDEDSKTKVVQNIASAMQPDGVVLMGHSESIYGQRHILQPDKSRTASISFIKASPHIQKPL